MATKKRLLLLDARRFGRAALDRLQKVQDVADYDIALDEAIQKQSRAVDWLDELVDTDEKEQE